MDEKEQETTPSSGISKSFIVIAVLALAVLVVGGYFLAGGSEVATKPADVNSAETAAVVNGVAISKTVYDTQLSAALATYGAQGVDVTNAEKLLAIKKEVLGVLVNNELLAQNIAAAGVKASSDDIEKQYQLILTQVGGADKLQAELVKSNLTDSQFRENIGKQLAVQSYLLQNIDTKTISVSDAEISQFYTDYSKAQKSSGVKTVPSLKELSEQIKQQLITNKQQTLVANFITALQGKAKIEISPAL